MKYLLTDKNHKPDFGYENALYFNRVIDRDNYINSLFSEPINYMNSINGDVISNAVNQDGSGTITIKPNLSRQELYDKNYIILRECGLEKPEFFFITNIRPIESKPGEYKLDVEKDMITSNPGFLDNATDLELIEGHIDDRSILDMVIDGGYKVASNIQPLERKASTTFGELYPNADVNMLDNQWIYVFIKSKNATEDAEVPYFKLNGQYLPYRVLVAPLNEILVKDNSNAKIKLCTPNRTWKRTYVEVGGSSDVNSQTDFDNNIKTTSYNLENVIESTNGTVKIKVSGEGKANHTTSGGTYTNELLEIPFASFESTYKDKWAPLFIGSKTHRDAYNSKVWSDTTPDDNTWTEFSKVYSTTMVMMKWNSVTNQLQFTSDWTVNTDWEDFINKVWFMGLEGRDWGTFVPLNWGHAYVRGWKETYEGTHEPEAMKITGGGGSNLWSGVNTNKVSDSPNYKAPSLGRFTISGTITAIAFTINSSASYWYSKIGEIYQGSESTVDNFIWNNQALIDYINKQYNNVDTNNPEVIISGKISSFNPIELSTNNGLPTNIYAKDSQVIPTPGDWNNNAVYELFELNTDRSLDFNTYDLTPYQDKSWIKGINNYSIMIENNKEFDIKPEYVYSYGEFVHSVIPSPIEWVERISWKNSLNNEGVEWSNNKEFLFGDNALGAYQLNNPGALSNQAANNNADKNAGILSSIATGAAVSVASGGAGLIIAGASIGKNIISAKKNKRNLKHNIAMMQQQPAVSTGSGSAYADLYLNNNAFGLTLIEWVYTTTQAPAVIDAVVRSGLQFSNTIHTSYSKIRRPQYNYIKTTNGIEALSNLELNNAEKLALADILDSGVRLWYNTNTFLQYSDPTLGQEYNDSFFTRDMINYIDWNSSDLKNK